jgi:hypothetical protein
MRRCSLQSLPWLLALLLSGLAIDPAQALPPPPWHWATIHGHRM